MTIERLKPNKTNKLNKKYAERKTLLTKMLENDDSLIMKFRKECIYRYSKYLHSTITNNTLTKQK